MNPFFPRSAAILMAAFCFGARAQAPAAPAAPAPVQAVPAPVYASVGERPAILYDALSTKANKLFILSRHHPVEVLVRLDRWSKVRDAEGTVGWLENADLSDRRHVQVAAATAEVRAAPQPSSPLVFEAQRGVILEVTGPAADGWLPVRHRDGQSGFVRQPQVWGA